MSATNQFSIPQQQFDIANIFQNANPYKDNAPKTYKKGQYIYLQSEQANKVFFVAKGKVKIGTYSESGKEITKSFVQVGEFFGELALLGEGKRRDFAVATESTTIYTLTTGEMQHKMKQSFSLNMFIMNKLGKRLRKIEHRVESLVFKTSRDRIVDFLKEQAAERGVRIGYEILVRGFLTHQEIANITATSRQTVTTVLNELRNKNLIYFNRRKLLIRDMAKLA